MLKFIPLMILFLTTLIGCDGFDFKTAVGNISGSSSCTYGNKVLISSDNNAGASGINVTDESFTDFTQTLTTSNGLPSNIIHHISHKDSLLFISTPLGLAVMGDNCSFTVIRTVTTTNGLPSDVVLKTEFAPNGDLWIITASGIAISTDNGATISGSTITTATPGLGAINFDFGGDRSYLPSVVWGPVTGTIVLAADGGVCRSTDGGSNFSCSTFGSGDINGLVVLGNGNFVAMATTGGGRLSTDDGATWNAGPALASAWANGLNVNSDTDDLFFTLSGWSSFSTDLYGSVSNFGATSGGAWRAYPLVSGKVVVATTGAGMFVYMDMAAVAASGTGSLPTSSHTTANGLFANKVRWVLDIP